jgi:WD40 repeat protein
MSERWRFRFSLRTTMVAVTLFCAALWWLVAHPRAIQQRQTVTGRQQIHQRDRLFLEACVDQSVREHLVTVLGDSRLSHWGSVRWLFGPDRDTIISHGNDGALIVWNRDDGSIREGFFDVPFAARAVDAGLIFMGDSKGNVRIWSVADKSFRDVQWQLPVLQNPTCTATPDGAYFVFGTYGGELTVWDAESGLRLNVIDLKADAQEGYEYEFHGPILGTKNHHLVAAAPKYLAEFDLMSGERLALVAIPATDDGGSASIFDLQLSDDEKKLFVGDAAGRVMAFDWEEHRYLEQVFYGATSISDFSFSADGRDLRVVRDGDVLGLEFWTNGQVITRSVYVGEVSALGDPSHFLMGTRSGRIVVLSGDDEARLKGGPRGDAVRFAYSPRGDRIALAGRDGLNATLGRPIMARLAMWNGRETERT